MRLILLSILGLITVVLAAVYPHPLLWGGWSEGWIFVWYAWLFALLITVLGWNEQ